MTTIGSTPEDRAGGDDAAPGTGGRRRLPVRPVGQRHRLAVRTESRTLLASVGSTPVRLSQPPRRRPGAGLLDASTITGLVHPDPALDGAADGTAAVLDRERTANGHGTPGTTANGTTGHGHTANGTAGNAATTGTADGAGPGDDATGIGTVDPDTGAQPAADAPGVPTPDRRPGLTPFRSAPVRLVRRTDRTASSGSRRRLPATWPLTALLVGFPFWWALGLSTFVFPLLAIPMTLELRRRRPIRLPRGFALWAVFLAWLVVSLVMLPFNPTYTLPGAWSGRLISISVSLAEYFGVTATLLFVGNMTERELPQLRVVRMLGVLFLTTVGGGLLGILAPSFSFTSPLERLLPASMRTDPYIRALVRPSASQVQSALSFVKGRPSAPFGYTNFWGNNYAILVIWFIAGWWLLGDWRRRAWCVPLLVLSLLPMIISLNRAAWLAVGLSVVYAAVRLALGGRLWAVTSLVALAAVGTLVFLLSPLKGVVEERLANPHSNDIRSLLSSEAIRGAKESPILGWGGTRKIIGSDNSITVGKTSSCPLCGNFAIGSNGQLWMVVFNQGFVGAIAFFGFFAASMWFYRRDGTVIGQAGVLVVGLTFVFMFFYGSLPSGLTFTMISVALLWRSDDARRRARLPVGSWPVAAVRR